MKNKDKKTENIEINFNLKDYELVKKEKEILGNFIDMITGAKENKKNSDDLQVSNNETVKGRIG